MPEDPQSPSVTDIVVQKFLGGSSQSIHKIKFGRGVVGKIAVIAVFAMIGIATFSPRVTQNGALIGIGTIAFMLIVSLVAIVVIALKQPELAVLEGMEVVRYKQLTIGAKGFTPDVELPPVPDPGLPKLPAKTEGGQ